MQKGLMIVFVALILSQAHAENATVKPLLTGSPLKGAGGEGRADLLPQQAHPSQPAAVRVSVSQQSKPKSDADKKVNVLGKLPALGLCDGS